MTEYTFDEKRPNDGQTIEVMYPTGFWDTATYWEDGVDGIVEDGEGEMCEIEEYGKEMRWRAQ